MLRRLMTLVFAIALWLVSAPAWADWSSPMSYSNADLKGRDFSGQTLQAAEISNANLELTNFANADVRGAIFSASVATSANFHGADMSNTMADQVDFTGADLSDAILSESILLRSTFNDTDITGTDFSDAILDGIQLKTLCAKASGTNSQTGITTRDSLGCR